MVQVLLYMCLSMNLLSALCSARPGTAGPHCAHYGWPPSPSDFAFSSLVVQPCSGCLLHFFLKGERLSLPGQTLVSCPVYASCLQGSSATWVPAATPDQPCSPWVPVLARTELIFAGRGTAEARRLFCATSLPEVGRKESLLVEQVWQTEHWAAAGSESGGAAG